MKTVNDSPFTTTEHSYFELEIHKYWSENMHLDKDSKDGFSFCFMKIM